MFVPTVWYFSQVLGDRIPPFFVKKNLPIFFFLFKLITKIPKRKKKTEENFFTKKGGIISPSTCGIIVFIFYSPHEYAERRSTEIGGNYIGWLCLLYSGCTSSIFVVFPVKIKVFLLKILHIHLVYLSLCSNCVISVSDREKTVKYCAVT